MRSAVSRRTLGECDAITSRGFGRSELTFVSALGIEFGASHKLVSGHSVRIQIAAIFELNTPTYVPKGLHCQPVLVQPEMERRRFPLVSIPPFGQGFSRHRDSTDPMEVRGSARRRSSRRRSS